jgi:acetolactate synthase-1/2/3 large subunit
VPSCGERVVELLESIDARTVFGIPGVHTLELYRGLSRSRLRHVAPRHEQGAAFMADGWARVSGRPGVCVLISGPGLTNAVTAVAQAYHDSIPMLVISGVVAERDRGRGEIHDLPDQQRLMSTVTAFSHSLSDAAELPEVFERAREVFDARRPRPVHVQIPVDVLRREAPDPPPALRARPERPLPSGESVQSAAALLQRGRSPVIVLGGGACDAGPQALALAERLAAPIGLTINARGTIDHDHPLCLGSALSFPPVSGLLRDADPLLLVGSELSDLDLWGLDAPLRPRNLIRVDIDPDQLRRRYPPAATLHGDAALTLALLAQACPAAGADRRAAAVARAAEAREKLRPPSEIARFAPLIRALDQALPRDRIVAGDSTQPVYAANHLLPMHGPRSWLMPIGYGCLGCALPMAIGAKLASPDRPVVALAGDGGFMFTIAELATASELGLTLPVIVYDNGGYGEIREAMDVAGVAHLGTDGTVPDLLAIARGFGCDAVQAEGTDALGELLVAALASDRPTVIQLQADR